MKREFDVLTLQQLDAAGALADGYAFEDFSCPLNKEVENFLRQKAIQSSRLGASVTYLVYDKKSSALLGYFTLLQKPFSIEETLISKSKRRLTAAVYLIAQIGKNFAIEEGRRIRGDELLALAFEKLYAAKELVGGKLVLVERDARSSALVKFYNKWNFQSWNERYDEDDGINYDQMLCALKSIS